MPISPGHAQYPYLLETVSVVHSRDPGVLALPIASVTGGSQDVRHTALVRVAREQYRRTVTIDFKRKGLPPELPPAAQPEQGEVVVSSTISLADPEFDPNGNPVYTLAGMVVFARESAPPGTVQYPKSPLRDEALSATA